MTRLPVAEAAVGQAVVVVVAGLAGDDGRPVVVVVVFVYWD